MWMVLVLEHNGAAKEAHVVQQKRPSWKKDKAFYLRRQLTVAALTCQDVESLGGEVHCNRCLAVFARCLS